MIFEIIVLSIIGIVGIFGTYMFVSRKIKKSNDNNDLIELHHSLLKVEGAEEEHYNELRNHLKWLLTQEDNSTEVEVLINDIFRTGIRYGMASMKKYVIDVKLNQL